MPTIAVRVPTVVPGVDYLPGGQCYVLFNAAQVSVRDLITAKVQGEIRKARAGGDGTTSLRWLLPAGATIGFSPLDEQLAIAQACHAFVAGKYLIVCNERPLVDLAEPVQLDRRTRIRFIVATPAPMTGVEALPQDAAA